MSYELSDAKRKANAKWRESQAQIAFRLPKEKKAEIDSHCASRGESINDFIRRAIRNQIAADNAEK